MISELLKQFRIPLNSWPGGVVSGFGELVMVSAILPEVWVGDPLTTTKYVVTLIVGAILTLVGPLVIARDRVGSRQVLQDVITGAEAREVLRESAELKERGQRLRKSRPSSGAS